MNNKALFLILSCNIHQMLIAWIQKTTLVDYPDKIATLLFTAGCNLKCRFCHNPELVLPERIKQLSLIPEENFFVFLKARKHLLEGVVLSGGEPTLQPDLLSFCRRVKEETWLPIKLDTNGRDPSLVQQLIEQKLIDYIAMDIKIDDAQWLLLLQKKEKLHPYHQTIRLLLQSPIPYEFRTTMIHPYHTQESFASMLRLISWAQQYVLQSYRPDKTLDPTFDGYAYTEKEMAAFQQQAQHYVQYCSIR